MSTPQGRPGDPATYVAPAPRELKRERKALLEIREERLRDLGGLALEMYKRDRFNAGLVVERCAELVALEAPVCICGTPIPLGAKFCATCGRALGGGSVEARPTGSDAVG